MILVIAVMFTVCADRCAASLIVADAAQWESMNVVAGTAKSSTRPLGYEDEDEHEERGRQGSWRAQQGMASDTSTSGQASGTSVTALDHRLARMAHNEFSVWLQSSTASIHGILHPAKIFRPPKV